MKMTSNKKNLTMYKENVAMSKNITIAVALAQLPQFAP